MLEIWGYNVLSVIVLSNFSC